MFRQDRCGARACIRICICGGSVTVAVSPVAGDFCSVTWMSWRAASFPTT